MYQDQMTPVERAKALAAGKDVDRMPVDIMYGASAHALLGWTLQQEWESGRSLSEAQKKLYQVLHVDSIGTGHGLHGLGLLYGAKAHMPKHEPLSLISYPLAEAKDYRQLDPDLVEKDTRTQKCFECLEILREELGNEVGCGMFFAGAFTAASGLLGPEKLLRSLIRDPENVHGLLRFANQALLRMAIPFVKAGFKLSLSDPMATGDILSPARFREFVYPYNKEFVDTCCKIRPNCVSVHICGDTTPLLEEIVNCGFSAFSIDNAVDLAVAKERIGDKIPLIGNVPPTDIMYIGTPEQVRQSVRECFRKAWDSPRGFTISTGCACPYGTPLENALAYMDEAKKCATMPYNIEYFYQ